MENKWCLLRASDGQRGCNGKKKIYEITISEPVTGGVLVRCEWGMAEKPQRASSTQYFYSTQAARAFAMNKVWLKRDKGYELAYAV